MYEKAIPKRQKYALFIFGIFMFFSASLCAQNLNFNFKNTSLKVVLQKITEQSAYDFAYSDALNVHEKMVTVSANNEKPELFFSRFFKAQGISYKIQLKQVFLTPQEIAPKNNSKKSFEITGIILDDLKTPLPGVAVQNIDSKTGVSSGIKGEFAINVSIGDRVRFSFLGLTTKEITISSIENKYIIELESDNVTLTDVVVTGYQTLSKERAAGSFTVVSKKQIERNLQTNIMDRIEGSVAGLTSYKGALQIRGISTLSGVSTPLFVVDGVPFEGSLNALNPSEIVNITILKDATAASIYGSRSANGVIVISTRNGSVGPTKITYNGSAFLTPLPDYDYQNRMSSPEFVDFQKTLFNLSPGTTQAGLYVNEVRQLLFDRKNGIIKSDEELETKLNVYRNRDSRDQTIKELLRKRQITHQHNLSFYGGTEKYKYALSFNYLQNLPYERIQSNDRVGFNLKNTFNLYKWLRADVGILGSRTKADNFTGFSGMSIYGGSKASYLVYKDEAGNPIPWYQLKSQAEIDRLKSLNLMDESYYPLDELRKERQISEDNYLNMNLNFNIRFSKELSLDLRYQKDLGYNSSKMLYDKESWYVKSMVNNATQIVDGIVTNNIPTGGQVIERRGNNNSYTMRAQLNYNKTIRDKHVISVIAGGERRRVMGSSMGTYKVGYDDNSLAYKVIDEKMLSKPLTNTQAIGGSFSFAGRDPGFSYAENRYISFYGNASYSYSNSLIATASIRMDQSNLFGTDPKYQYRPLWSLGLQYTFKKLNIEWLDRLAARATYGINGNIAKMSGPFLTVSSGGVNPWINDYSSLITFPPNSGLRWEKTAVANVGIDFELLKYRLGGSIEVYNKNTTDLLGTKDADPTLGWSSLMVNYGDMYNRGVEISLNSKNYVSRDFSWSTNVYFSYNKNRMTRIENPQTDAIYYIQKPQIRIDQPMNSLYSIRWAGLDDKGAPQAFKKDGTIVKSFSDLKLDDLVYSGITTPPYAASMSNSFEYKNFDMSFLLTYYGGHVMRGAKAIYLVGTAYATNPDRLTGNFWQKAGDESDASKAPAFKQGASANMKNLWEAADTHIQKADYVKLKSLVLGYSIPSHMLKKSHISNAKISIQMTNIWYWAANSQGLDPEAWSGTSLSTSRGSSDPATYTLGLSLTF